MLKSQRVMHYDFLLFINNLTYSTNSSQSKYTLIILSYRAFNVILSLKKCFNFKVNERRLRNTPVVAQLITFYFSRLRNLEFFKRSR